MKLLPFLAILAVLGGCSSAPRVPDYVCPLQVSEKGKCASVHDGLKASMNMTSKESRQGNPQSAFDAQVSGGNASEGPKAAPYYGGAAPSGFPEAEQQGAPVFQQPKVMRVWVAPYVDADGNLRSGEYAYFSTPGQWNYGSLKKPGSGAAATGMFQPVKPNQLGFTPSFKANNSGQSNEATPPKPESSNTPAPPAAAAAAAKATTSVNSGITQPYERISK